MQRRLYSGCGVERLPPAANGLGLLQVPVVPARLVGNTLHCDTFVLHVVSLAGSKVLRLRHACISILVVCYLKHCCRFPACDLVLASFRLLVCVGSFMVQPCTATSHPVCQACTECSHEQGLVEGGGCSGKQDRVCLGVIYHEYAMPARFECNVFRAHLSADGIFVAF